MGPDNEAKLQLLFHLRTCLIKISSERIRLLTVFTKRETSRTVTLRQASPSGLGVGLEGANRYGVNRTAISPE
jgi:hypothetical protein